MILKTCSLKTVFFFFFLQKHDDKKGENKREMILEEINCNVSSFVLWILAV